MAIASVRRHSRHAPAGVQPGMPSSDAERQQQGRIWRLGLAAAGAPVSRRVGMGHVEALDQNDLKSGALGRWRSLDRFKISADFLKRAFKPPPRAQRVSHAWCQLGLSCDSAQLTLAYRRHPYGRGREPRLGKGIKVADIVSRVSAG